MDAVGFYIYSGHIASESDVSSESSCFVDQYTLVVCSMHRTRLISPQAWKTSGALTHCHECPNFAPAQSSPGLVVIFLPSCQRNVCVLPLTEHPAA